MGNQFLCVGIKVADNRASYFFVLGNASNLESGLYDQMRKILIFEILFLKIWITQGLFLFSVLSSY